MSTLGRKVLATPSKMVLGFGQTLANVGEKAYLTGKALTISKRSRKNVIQESKRAAKKTPKTVRDQYVTVDEQTGKVSLSPQNIINIGITAGSVYLAGKQISHHRAATIKKGSMKTIEKSSTPSPKGRTIQTKHVRTFKNLKGQQFKSTTKSSVSKTTGKGTYKTLIKDVKTGKTVNTIKGKIIPKTPPKTNYKGEFESDTYFTKNKGSDTRIQEKGQHLDIIKEKFVTERLTTKNVKVTGQKPQHVLSKEIIVTKGKTSNFFDIFKSSKKAPFPKSVTPSKSLMNKAGLFSSKKASVSVSHSADSTGFNFGTGSGLNTNVQPLTFPKTPQPQISQTPAPFTPSVPVSSGFLTTPPFIPVIPVPFKSKPFEKPANKVNTRFNNNITDRTQPFNIVKTNNDFLSNPVPRPKTQPVDDSIFKPEIITTSSSFSDPKPMPRNSTFNDAAYYPTPSPTPTPATIMPIVAPSVPFFPIFPKLTSGGGGLFTSTFKTKKRRSRIKKFKPTLRSSAFNIKGVTSPSAELTGLGERYAKKKKF